MDPLNDLAHRLGERELALRDCVDACGFSLRLDWNISILQAHISRGCVDGPPVRCSICVLDVLPARPAAAYLGQATAGSTRTAFAIVARYCGHPYEA